MCVATARQEQPSSVAEAYRNCSRISVRRAGHALQTHQGHASHSKGYSAARAVTSVFMVCGLFV